MQFLYELFNLVVSFLGSLLLLRAYLWALAVGPRDPVVSFTWRFTDWLVNPVSYLVRPRGNWDWPSLLASLFVAVVGTLVTREVTGFPVTPAAFAVAPFALVLRWGINFLIWMVLLYALVSFFGPRMMGYQSLLGMLTDPFLRPIRRVLPRWRNFDFSPVVLFIVLSLILRWLTPLSMGVLFF